MNITLSSSGGFTLTPPSGQPITIPPTLAGLGVMRKILTAHQSSPNAPIGNTSNPIQYMVDEWLKQDAEIKRAEAQATLANLGLSTITLSI